MESSPGGANSLRACSAHSPTHAVSTRPADTGRSARVGDGAHAGEACSLPVRLGARCMCDLDRADVSRLCVSYPVRSFSRSWGRRMLLQYTRFGYASLSGIVGTHAAATARGALMRWAHTGAHSVMFAKGAAVLTQDVVAMLQQWESYAIIGSPHARARVRVRASRADVRAWRRRDVLVRGAADQVAQHGAGASRAMGRGACGWLTATETCRALSSSTLCTSSRSSKVRASKTTLFRAVTVSAQHSGSPSLSLAGSLSTVRRATWA